VLIRPTGWGSARPEPCLRPGSSGGDRGRNRTPAR
jgi:hypothetical protein